MSDAMKLLRQEITSNGKLALYAKQTGDTLYVFANNNGGLMMGTSPIGMNQEGYSILMAEARHDDNRGNPAWTLVDELTGDWEVVGGGDDE